jgi:hypothetical protein
MSSVIINNIDFDILTFNINQIGSSFSNNRSIYGVPHTVIEIIAETSINNISLLQNWTQKVYTTDSFRVNNNYVKLLGVFPKQYQIDFQSNSNSSNVEVILVADSFLYVTDIRKLRKEKLEKINELATTTK